MNLKKFAKTALPALALTVAASTTMAAQINALFDPTLPGGINEIQDQDVERVLRDTTGDGQLDTVLGAADTLAIGDTFETILRWDTVNVTTIGDVIPAPYQLTAYSQLEISSVIFNNDGVDGINGTPDDIFDLVFIPSGNLKTPNSFVDLYEGNGGYDSSLAPAAGIASVTGDTYLASFGLGEADDFWLGQGPLDLGVIASLSEGDPQAAAGVFGLSVTANPGNLPIGTNGIVGADGNLHDVVGNTSVFQKSPGTNAGWLVASNTSAAFQVVPAPATLALFGLGLAGLSLRVKMRKRT